jgi:uncharacterized protein (DUF58 family)
MIVPTKRLTIWCAVTIPPLTLLPVLRGDAAAMPALGIGLILFLLALVDGALAQGRSTGISVSLPKTVRMTKDREGSLELSLKKAYRKAAPVRLGLPFPPEISSPREDLPATLPQGTDIARIAWPCTPLARGLFHIDTCYVETRSHLGLWAFRGLRKVACEVRVYPSLARERKSLAALFLNRGGFGVHGQRQQGKGREFERLRDYIPGDGYDEIHWKATAKRRHPITKVFQIERTQEVYVVIDASRLSARPAKMTETVPDGGDDRALKTRDSQLERFIAAALVVGLAAQKQGDLFGLVTFSDSVHDFLRAGGGKSHYSACREHIFNLYPRMVNPDYEELCTFIRLKLRRRALIIMLTSLDDPVLAESLSRTMELICRHHLVMVNMFRPAGAQPLFSNPDIASTEEIYDALSGHVLWHNLRELEKGLTRHGVHFALLDHERLCVDLVSQYMNVKQRQLL